MNIIFYSTLCLISAQCFVAMTMEKNDSSHLVCTKKSYACTHFGCEKTFMRSSALTRHLRAHTGRKPYICPHAECDKAFARSDGLVIHLRKHTGEKPYACNHPGCGKAFTQSGGLTSHLRIHNKEKMIENEIIPMQSSDTLADYFNPFEHEPISLEAAPTHHASIDFDFWLEEIASFFNKN